MLFESMSRGLVPGSRGVFAACLTPGSGSLRNEKMGTKGMEGSLPPQHKTRMHKRSVKWSTHIVSVNPILQLVHQLLTVHV